MWSSECLFSLSFVYMILFFCIYVIIAGILNLRVDDMLYLPGNFSGCFAGGGLGAWFSLTHTLLCIYHEWDPKTPDLKKIRIRGIRNGCTSYFSFHENPSQSLFSYRLFIVHLARKLGKVTNQHMMTLFRPKPSALYSGTFSCCLPSIW